MKPCRSASVGCRLWAICPGSLRECGFPPVSARVLFFPSSTPNPRNHRNVHRGCAIGLARTALSDFFTASPATSASRPMVGPVRHNPCVPIAHLSCLLPSWMNGRTDSKRPGYPRPRGRRRCGSPACGQPALPWSDARAGNTHRAGPVPASPGASASMPRCCTADQPWCTSAMARWYSRG